MNKLTILQFFLALTVFSTTVIVLDAVAFDPTTVDMTLDDVQVTEYPNYDVIKLMFSLFNGDSQDVTLSGHKMLYLNDTNGIHWEYSSHNSLPSFSSTDCPVLNSTIPSNQSASITQCYLISNASDIGYNLVLNNYKYIADFETTQYVLESVPSWLATTANAWCTDAIPDAEYFSSLQYYIGQGTINVLKGQSGADVGAAVPAWVKTNACDWSSGQISDYEYLDGIYWLIDNGKIQI